MSVHNLGTQSISMIFCSITEYCKTHDIDAESCVEEMRRIVKEETKLTASAGIAPNKASKISDNTVPCLTRFRC